MKLQYKLIAAALAAMVSLSSSWFIPTENNQNIVTVNAAEQEAVISFSAESGFYGEDFGLTLSADSGGDIYYTTDGSNPASSSTAQLYKGAIKVNDRTNEPNIYSTYGENSTPQLITDVIEYEKPTFCVDKATVVRAVVMNPDGTYSKPADRTYFITGGNLSQYQDTTVVSLVTDPDNLFDPDTGIYVMGSKYFNWQKNYSVGENTELLPNYCMKGREWEREASVSIFRKGKTIVDQNMGIRIKGHITRNYPQKSFNLYARSAYGPSKINYPLIDSNFSIDSKLINKYDSVSLRAVSSSESLRDGYAQKLISGRKNITTQNMQQCVVFLNGEYWGLYEMTEKFSDYFIESNYGIKKENVAMIRNEELEEGSQSEYDSFFKFVDTYSKKDLTIPENYNAVCDFIDIDSIIEHYAAGMYLGNCDWPNNNFGVWRNTGDKIDGNQYSDGRWEFISFDFDYALNDDQVLNYEYDIFRYVNRYGDWPPTNIFLSLLKNEEFRNKFVSVYCDYANDIASPQKAEVMLEDYRKNYAYQYGNSIVRWKGTNGFSKEEAIKGEASFYTKVLLDNTRMYFNKRADYTLKHMKDYLGLSGTLQTVTLQKNGNGKIQISSIIPDLSSGKWSGKYYSDCPVTLTAIPDEGSSFTGWSGDVTSGKKTITVTLEKAMNIQADFGEAKDIKGDVNADGIPDAADIVLMQKYMFGEAELTDSKAGDMNDDGIINISDLCLIKGELLNNSLKNMTCTS